MTTVLVVDDHPLTRDALVRLLAANGFEVAGEAGGGEEAVERARELAPDVVLLDINLPGIDGLEVARRLTSDRVPGAIVLVSSREQSDFGELIGASGARGFIAKGELSGTSLEALLA
jgi:DNA-binding NarL/FixJ family response regulator